MPDPKPEHPRPGAIVAGILFLAALLPIAAVLTRGDAGLRASGLRSTNQDPGAPSLAGCPMLPPDDIWNTPVDELPLDPRSEDYIETIGADVQAHPDFGSGLWQGGPIGIPYVLVPGDQPRVPVSFRYADESDPGPYPIPTDAPIEGGPNGTGDRHILVVDEDDCMLYETFDTHPEPGGGWRAGSGAVFDLSSSALRPDTWTSADAAGLPILPGLIRYDEVAAGEIKHAIRFTAPRTQRAYVWPARHYASSITDPAYPPMGQRFRLRADYPEAGYSAEVQVILRALKRYGMMLADNGSAWFLIGAPDERWNNSELRGLKDIRGRDFEAVDVSGLMIDPDSGRARQPGATAVVPTEPLPSMTATRPETATVVPSATATPLVEHTPTATSAPVVTATLTSTPTATPLPEASPTGLPEGGRIWIPWTGMRRR